MHHQSFQRNVGWDADLKNRIQYQELRRNALNIKSGADKIAKLVKEIDGVLDADLHRKAINIYGLNALIANLAFLNGDMLFFNCRSGKDRTGMLETEIKYLAYLLDANQNIGYDGAVEFAPVFQQLLFDFNEEVQFLNTRKRGSKLKPITADLHLCPIVRRVGIDNWDRFKGESDSVDE